MSDFQTFFPAQEQTAIRGFLDKGYYQFKIKHIDLLNGLRGQLFQWAKELIELPAGLNEAAFFDTIADFVPVVELNRFRMGLIGRLTAAPQIRPWLYHMAREPLELLVGNELAMQRSLNLSIQFPHDDSSLLPLHSDVWSGNSPYEVVFWMPLVDCYATKSMYVLPRNASDKVLADFPRYAGMSAEGFFKALEPEMEWMEVPYGEGLIFTHSIIHGNRTNQEPHTRWSMNTRFKSLLSPYGSKELGESFLPITIRPATRVGYEYKEPRLD